VLLRTAIGWHFTTEGLAKFDEPFSAEGYFRNATGPLAPYFRDLVPDADGRERLARGPGGLPDHLKSEWRAELERYATHFAYTPEQRAEAEKALTAAEADADAWFRDIENRNKTEAYLAKLEKLREVERDPNILASYRKQSWKDRRTLETERKELMAPIDTWTKTLHDTWTTLGKDSPNAKLPVLAPTTRLDWINWLTKYGLVIAGIGLMAGLLTRLSALYGAGFLLLLYLAMPPWPGMPPAPGPGHDWIVNNQLIEALACLVLVFLPTGRWIGLDSLVFGWLGRGREAIDPNEPNGHDDAYPLAGDGRRPAPLERSSRR
jgi:uncharacterized membrane protein YphA (DoxX/SURF4 family)